MPDFSARHLDAGAELFGGGIDFAELAEAFRQPMFWPDLPAEIAAREWDELRRWVQRIVERFAWDSHVLPACWWRHNHIVEALAALRDHERGSYARSAPPSAAVEFHRALRDIEERLRFWTTELRCEASHDRSHDHSRVLSDDGWQEWIATDTQRRHEAQIAAALDGERS
jgi:hypothetical protein